MMLETLIQSPGVVVAVLEGVAPDGQPLISWEGQHEPQPAYAVVWMGQHAPDWQACKGLRAVIAFEQGDEARPILLGLLDTPPASTQTPQLAVEPQPEQQDSNPAPPLVEPDAQAPSPDILHLESDKELVLQCGKAKIALRADGRVTILGGHVVSRSTGVNKIKGGSVHIN